MHYLAVGTYSGRNGTLPGVHGYRCKSATIDGSQISRQHLHPTLATHVLEYS